MLRRGLIALAVLVLVAIGAFAALAYHPAIGKVAVAEPDQILVRHGVELAAIGDCAACHTAAHGAAYAGGRAIQTPFGTLFSSNITPDEQTGIGGWPLAAFIRAMRHGVSRDGRNLYPALPYTHFTKMSDDDLASLYAYFMAQPAVFSQPAANRLPFPLNWRPLLAGWNLLFLDDRRFAPDPAHDAEWNRGAYLVGGLAHCGACHTPHNALGAEQSGKALAGGEAEGWHPPALAGASWSVDSLTSYLRTGADPHHGAAAGPMAPVWWNLARVPETDVRAMATYVASFAGPPAPQPADNPDAANLPGAAIFAGACASCHGPAAPMMQEGGASLGYSAAVAADDPGNLLRVLLRGIRPEQYRAGPQMPAFATMLTDAQVADVAAYLRVRFAPGRPAWPGLAEAAHTVRSEGNAS